VPLSGVPTADFRISLLLFTMIPAHLFISLWIEVWAAHKARKIKAGKQDPKKMERKGSWGLIRFTHIVNIGICLGVTSVAVYTMVYHPLLGMICEMHAGTLPIFLFCLFYMSLSVLESPLFSIVPSLSRPECSYRCAKSRFIRFNKPRFARHVLGIHSDSRRIQIGAISREHQTI